MRAVKFGRRDVAAFDHFNWPDSGGGDGTQMPLDVVTRFILCILVITIHPRLAQADHVCTEAQIMSYLGNSSNTATCRAATATVLSTPSGATAQQIEAALETFCSSDCGKIVLDFLILQCKDRTAFEYYFMCLRTHGTSSLGPYCDIALRNQFDFQSPRALVSSCSSSVSSGNCSNECETALTNFKDNVGCCLQHVYHPFVLNRLGEVGEMSQKDIRLLNSIINNFDLWSTCGLTRDSECTGLPLPPPRSHSLIFGTCTRDQFSRYMTRLNTSCQRNIQLTFATDILALSRINADELCAANCVGFLVDFQNNTCASSFDSVLSIMSCLVTEGSLGDRCHSSLSYDTIFPLISKASDACGVSNDSCPTGCTHALQTISSAIGCCYQSIYNNSFFLDVLYVSVLDTRAKFAKISSARLWEICGVPLVDQCPVLQFLIANMAQNENSAAETAIMPATLLVLILIFLCS